MESDLPWITAPEHRPALQCGGHPQRHVTEGSWLSLSHQLLSVNNFSAGCGTLCSLRFHVVGFCLTWSCAGRSLWVHMDLSPIMPGRCCFLGIVHISGSYNLSISLPHRSPSLEERAVIKSSHSGWAPWSLSHPSTLSSWGLCNSSHLL